jgi:hypothetical protein
LISFDDIDYCHYADIIIDIDAFIDADAIDIIIIIDILMILLDY